MRKKLISLIGIMLILTIAATAIIQLSDKQQGTEMEGKDKLQIMTTFYPIYMIVLNIADGIDEIEINNLTEMNTGCLHDYQLTTEDMKNISKADLLIINGGGMEGFLQDVSENDPDLNIIDTSDGITMLHSEGEEEAHIAQNDNISAKDQEGHGPEDHNHGEWNAHVWLDPELYIKQIENVREGMIAYIESNQANDTALIQAIKYNAQIYIEKVSKLNNDILEYAKNYTIEQTDQGVYSNQVVIFHDSFAYLAKRIGMNVAHAVPLDSDTSLSAGEIAEIVEEVKRDNIHYLFTEEQFSDSIAKQIEAETDAKMYIINSAVTGDGSKDSYIKAMEANLTILKEAMMKE